MCCAVPAGRRSAVLHISSRVILACNLGFLALVAACSSPTTVTPPPAPTAGPSVTCPADIAVDAVASPSPVTYPSPVATDGTPPVQTSCTIASGGLFPLGTTDVICTARDAASRSAQCVFHVKVTGIPRILGTKILAFGDSITCCQVFPPISVQAFDPDHSYPTVLQGLVTARYKTQTVTVFRAGVEGESVSDGTSRLLTLLDTLGPDVLILFEGINDVNGLAGLHDYSSVIGPLRTDIRRARQRGVRLIILSTFLPQVPGLLRAYNPAGVVEVNSEIRALAATEGALLVDNYVLFEPKKLTLIGDDGLHPTIDGHRALAENFLSAISKSFEETPIASTAP